MGDNTVTINTDRDEKGRFLKGHRRLSDQPGHVGGHPKSMKRQVKDALQIAEDAMPEIIEGMIIRAKMPLICPHCKKKILLVGGGQREGEYLADRIYGKASLPINLDSKKPMIIHVVYDEEKGA